MAEEKKAQYLAAVAEALTFTSPAVAAFLRSEQNAADGDSGRSCQACGSILILGYSCRKVNTPKQRRTGTARQIPSEKEDVVRRRLECQKCGAITTIEPATKPRKSTALGHKIRKTSTILKTAVAESGPEIKASPSALQNPTSAKKRSRSKKSSLQALLAGQKPTTTQQTTSLGLMDFLKK